MDVVVLDNTTFSVYSYCWAALNIYWFLQARTRAGVIPLEALDRNIDLLWISCWDERSLIVSGVTDYLLQDEASFILCRWFTTTRPGETGLFAVFIVVEKRMYRINQDEFANLELAMAHAKCLNEFVTIVGPDFEVCGRFGVDSVRNGVCPDGVVYDWNKASRIGRVRREQV